jgi:tRNA A37 methylthiotransferase MiaB
MRRAAEEEAQHARAIKSIDENDVPLVPVVVDGCWSKRSYNTNYNALSGAAAIIGQHTGYETNMYCVFCAHNKDENAKFHIQSRTEKSRASLIKKFSQN